MIKSAVFQPANTIHTCCSQIPSKNEGSYWNLSLRGVSWIWNGGRFALRCPRVDYLGGIDSYVYAWYALKIFFHRFHFLSPSEPSKVKNHAQNSLFWGVKNHGFWHVFYFRGLGGWQKMKTMKKYFQSISGIHIATDSDQKPDQRASESKPAPLWISWPPPLMLRFQ